MKTQTELAIRNLELAGLFDKDSAYGGMIGEAVKKLLLVHQAEGHSGASNSITAIIFAKVAQGEALTIEYWQEVFEEYNKFAKEEGHNLWTEESFEEIVMKKPK